MSHIIAEQAQEILASRLPGAGKRVGVVGAPLAHGAGHAGVDLAPAAMRIAGLVERIASLGYEVEDAGDIRIIRQPATMPINPKARYLKEIADTCAELAAAVMKILEAGAIPVVLGGDHSIAAGTASGVAAVCRNRGQSVGLLWFDAHGDMNTPETTPSGNVHGMPLAALFGCGAKELTHLLGYAPKFDPRFCVHVGARDLDAGEKELIRKLGVRFITMREIDERGMSACVDEAIAIASKAPAGFHATFDIDVLDPTEAPGSGTVVRGGLTYREAHLAMEKVAEASRLTSFEIVEINPSLDVNSRTVNLGVELVLSALGKTIL
jgi:arginase